MNSTTYTTRPCLSIVILSVLAQLASEPVRADTEKSYQIEEVIVTARKKSESAQDVPISIATFDSKSIRENGFDSTLSIDDKVPNLKSRPLADSPTCSSVVSATTTSTLPPSAR